MVALEEGIRKLRGREEALDPFFNEDPRSSFYRYFNAIPDEECDEDLDTTLIFVSSCHESSKLL